MLCVVRQRSTLIDITCIRIPISSVNHDIQIDSIKRWQNEWQNCTKVLTKKLYFSSVEERLNKTIKITQKVAAVLTGHRTRTGHRRTRTGHRRTRAYVHRFKIRDNAHCVGKQGDRTVNHLLYDCNLLSAERRILRKNITKNGQLPVDSMN
jgi:hypothetical protein